MNNRWTTPIAAGVMAAVFALGGVYLGAEAGPMTIATPPIGADADDHWYAAAVASAFGGTYRDRRNERRLILPGPGRREGR